MPKPSYPAISLARPEDLGGGEWHLKNLSNVVAVFGKNGSGKSRLFRAWRDVQWSNSHYIVPERTGELDYRPDFVRQQVTAQSRQAESQRNFHSDYRRQIVGRIQAYLLTRAGDEGVKAAPCPPSEITRAITRLLPDFELRIRATDTPPYELLRMPSGQAIEQIDGLSSGEAQLLLLGLDILTVAAMWKISGAAHRVMLIDEPDAHVHTDLVIRFADFLVEAAEEYQFQVLIATHSPSLLAALGQFAGDEASVLYLDRVGCEFAAQPFDTILRELTACLGGHALMGPLFGMPLLLVEGDDDYRIWSQVPRHHKVNFSVVPCGGHKILDHQRALERVFSALREPGGQASGYALIDNDKGKPQENVETPQSHIKFIQINCHES